MSRYADKYLIHFRKPLTNICKETFATKLMDCGRALAFNPANPSNYLGQHSCSHIQPDQH